MKDKPTYPWGPQVRRSTIGQDEARLIVKARQLAAAVRAFNERPTTGNQEKMVEALARWDAG